MPHAARWTPYAASGGVKLTRVITTIEGFLRPYKCFITLTKQLAAVGYGRSNYYNIDFRSHLKEVGVVR